MLACVTPAENPRKEKPFDFCYCGQAEDSQGVGYCAIWGESNDPGQPQKVWESIKQEQCEPQHCSQFFSKFCKKMQMSALNITGPRTEPQACYCDALLIENDKGQVQMFCGAWADNDKFLIEYYALDSCPPQRCQTAPFYKAAKICKNGFKPFYQNSSSRP